jgi:hypothetical protein
MKVEPFAQLKSISLAQLCETIEILRRSLTAYVKLSRNVPQRNASRFAEKFVC